ncbi:MAG TPA: sigma-70 family RNA polymerase sigma factor [Nannocystaceae bacterium]|nr:sigma-70 family RNA polymerase sigma factor [Nannocystaceae bacterium]
MEAAQQRLRERVRAAADAHELAVDREALEQLAWSRVDADATAIDALDLDAMILALACAEGQAKAIREFEARYFGSATAALRRMGLSDEHQLEALAQTRAILFVGNDGAPRILELVGKGDLRALVKVVAVRRALNLQRAERGLHIESSEALADAIAEHTSPELGALKDQHRTLVKAALSDALASLDPESRTLLRLSLLHELSIDELAAMHHIHRSTVARRIAKIRDNLRTVMHERLVVALGRSSPDVESMLRIANSGLEISFDRLLASRDARGE